MATGTRRRKIDVNTASASEIERACGIAGVLAERIVAYRGEHGPFKTRDDLDKVPGFAEVRTDEVLSVVDLPAARRRSTSSRSTSGGSASSRSTSSRSSSSGSSSSRSASTRGSASHAAKPGETSAPRKRASSTRGSTDGSSGTSTTRRRSRSAEPTTDHEFIRKWVEERGGWPASVKGTGRGRGDTGMIRIDFPGFSGRQSLERIEWDEWFRQFDENGLAFLHRDMKHSDGDLDRFNKLVKRKPADGDNK